MSAEMHGVEVRGHSLFVDGVEVWQDKNHEPDDMLLSRDLFEFVAVIRRLTSERDAQRARAEEAELGCDVLAVGDPYERLASTLEAGKVALRERDAASARASELEMVVHVLMRRLGTDDVGLRPEEWRQAAADRMLRDLYVVTDPGQAFEEGARVRASPKRAGWYKR